MVLGPDLKVIAVIPARYASERFPGKVIVPLAGKPLVLHAYEQARQSRLVTETVIATDDERVVEALLPYGVNVTMTRRDHETGTDRIAELAKKSDADIIVNVQADEPQIDPDLIDATVQPLLEDLELPMATARHPIRDAALIADPNCVKVVCDEDGRALYFSRSPIPFLRGGAHDAETEDIYWQHIGLYVYRREFLLKYAKMPPTPLEQFERLEQLRVLENGYSIAVVEAEKPCIGVDTPEDLHRVQEAMGVQSSK